MEPAPGHWPADTDRRIAAALFCAPFSTRFLIIPKRHAGKYMPVFLRIHFLARLATEILRQIRGIRGNDYFLFRVSAKIPRRKINGYLLAFTMPGWLEYEQYLVVAVAKSLDMLEFARNPLMMPIRLIARVRRYLEINQAFSRLAYCHQQFVGQFLQVGHCSVLAALPRSLCPSRRAD